MRTDTIFTMRSYFAPEVGSKTFAASVLRRLQANIARTLQEQGFVAKGLLEVLSINLREQPDNSEAPLPAFVTGGNWYVKCPDCAGCEFVDPVDLVMMCCACWNAAVDHRFRRVVMPDEQVAIEALLLQRPEVATRGWAVGQTTEDLRRENAEHELD